MKPEKTVEELLRWRLVQARAEAPPRPSASQLLELARPWWEKWPEKFQSRVEHLRRIQVGPKDLPIEPARSGSGSVVPAVIVYGAEESDGFARALEFNIRNDTLRFRFQVEPPLTHADSTLDLTFISDTPARPLLAGLALGSMESEYLLDTVVSPEIARNWAHLKETDHLPFRLIICYGTGI